MTDIVVPKWGLTMEEAVLVTWLKQVGDAVTEGEGVADMETDKADAELVSPCAGVLSEIIVPAGSSVEPGQVIGRIEEA